MLKYLTLFILAIALTAADKKSLDTKINTATQPREKLENDFYDWYKRHAQVVGLSAKNKYDIIFIGDSITHMFGGQPQSNKNIGAKVWDAYYAKRKVLNMGFGWDRTQNVLWRLENKELSGQTPKVVVVLIGTNNLAGTKNSRVNNANEIVEGITAVCEKVHTLSPTSKIILLGVLPRKGNQNTIVKEINKKLPELAKKDFISFLDLTKQLTDENGNPNKNLYKDSVHINAAGYKIWATAIEPLLERLLK